MGIKAGKGYDDKGHPIGVSMGRCWGLDDWFPDCDGTRIATKMNISNKGFDCTGEIVCNKCGLIHPGPYEVLGKHAENPLDCDKKEDKHPHYKLNPELIKYYNSKCIDIDKDIHIAKERINKNTHWEVDDALTKYYNEDGEELYHKRHKCNDKEAQKEQKIGKVERKRVKQTYESHWATHQDWKEQNCCPTYEPDTTTEYYEEGEQPEPLKDMSRWIAEQIAIGNAIGCCNARHAILYNRSDEERQAYRHMMHTMYAEVVASQMQMNQLQLDQVKYIMNKYGVTYTSQDGKYPYEDVIYHLCLYVQVLQLGRKSTGILKEARLQGRFNKTLYSLIRQKLDEESI